MPESQVRSQENADEINSEYCANPMAARLIAFAGQCRGHRLQYLAFASRFGPTVPAALTIFVQLSGSAFVGWSPQFVWTPMDTDVAAGVKLSAQFQPRAFVDLVEVGRLGSPPPK